MQQQNPDRSALVYRHHEQIYRLALLLTGDAASAASLVERAYRELRPDSPDVEVQLIHALLGGRGKRARGRPHIAEDRLTYMALDREQAEALLATLAALTTAERLVIGLHYLRGMSVEEIARLLGSASPASGQANWEPARVQAALTRFRAAAARAIELVPADVEPAIVLELDRLMDGRLSEEAAIELRRAVFEQPAVRAARDGLTETRDLLQQAIPALFAAAPPPELTGRLLKLTERRERIKLRRSFAWARAALALGVLVIAAAIALGPSLLRQRDTPTLVRAPTAADLIDSAIHRFDRATTTAGVLHEQYRVVASDQPAYLIERWYDYTTPHRLRITVRAEDAEGRAGPALLDIGSDGQSLVQYRNGNRRSGQRSFDAHVSTAEAQAALAVLRSGPTATLFSRNLDELNDIAPQYLAQAREAGAAYLGQTTMLARPAFLLAYRTDQLPNQSPEATPTTVPSQVILTIDAQTYSLLDIAVVADGVAESTAIHPFQAQTFEILPEVPDTTWQLSTSGRVMRRDSLPSARVPEIPSEQVIALDEALRRATHPLLVPQQLPDEPMHGVAVVLASDSSEQMLLLYEGQFQTIMLAPTESFGFGNTPIGSEEFSAGAFRYRLVELNDMRGPRAAAVAFRPESPDQQTLVMLVDEYMTNAEREAALGQLIGSLTPVTIQNLPSLRGHFSRPTTAGGQD